MLLDDVVRFCDNQYSSYGDECGCDYGICNHPSGTCSGSCYNCLYHIHFPGRAPEGAKKDYDCVKMLYHYVCQYSFLYSKELLCAFEHEWRFIQGFPYYHILSLGCGGCADLMAFDSLMADKRINIPVSYIGLDKNALWTPIHQRIHEYCSNGNVSFNVRYADVFEYFKKYYVPGSNIIVISYLISHLYNTNQIAEINSLAKDLVDTIKEKDTPLLLIINDVNSYKRGRSSFSYFVNAIQNCGLTVSKSEYKYFDTGNLYDGQRLGTPYSDSSVCLDVPLDIRKKYHADSSINQTVQLLVEVQ